MSFREELAKYTAEAEGIIGSFLPAEEGEAGKLAEAMNYSINAGGQRLRPVMMKMGLVPIIMCFLPTGLALLAAICTISISIPWSVMVSVAS